MTKSELLEALNSYQGEDIWNDVIYQSSLLDADATEAADPNYMNDVIVLKDGSRIDFDYQANAWVETEREANEVLEFEWTREERPGWDGTGTIAESWTAEHGDYVARIDRFTEEEGGGYAYTVTIDGNPIRNGENEPADSFEEAEAAVRRLLGPKTWMAYLGDMLLGQGTSREAAIEAAVREYEAQAGYGEYPLLPSREELISRLDVSNQR